MTIRDFSFAQQAPDFNAHIGDSIPCYSHLIEKCVSVSRRFVQSHSNVLDLGCSTGHLIRAIRSQNKVSRLGVNYIGLDIEPNFSEHWRQIGAKDVRFECCDARTWDGFHNLSLVCSLFTVQFVRPADKLALLGRIYDGLLPGGALIISEKILASSSRIQDALTFPFYDDKLRHFTPKQILDKERQLRGQMTLWTEQELRSHLDGVGFREVEQIWGNFPFAGFLALK